MTKIGITGHQRFNDATAIDWIKQAIRERVESERELTGLSSLAAGADQAFAEVVLAVGGSLLSIIPFPAYASSFGEPKDLENFSALLGRSTQVVTLPWAGSEELSYLEAGKYVVDHCDLLIAVWNGKPAAGLGGTADIVAYARSREKPTLYLNPNGRRITESRG